MSVFTEKHYWEHLPNPITLQTLRYGHLNKKQARALKKLFPHFAWATLEARNIWRLIKSYLPTAHVAVEGARFMMELEEYCVVVHQKVGAAVEEATESYQEKLEAYLGKQTAEVQVEPLTSREKALFRNVVRIAGTRFAKDVFDKSEEEITFTADEVTEILRAYTECEEAKQLVMNLIAEAFNKL